MLIKYRYCEYVTNEVMFDEEESATIEAYAKEHNCSLEDAMWELQYNGVLDIYEWAEVVDAELIGNGSIFVIED